MAMQEIEHKKRLIELANAIRAKHQALKENDLNFRMKMEKKFQPLLEKSNQQSSIRHKQKIAGENVENEDLPPTIICDDKLFGIKRKKDAWFLGNYPITFSHSKITVCGKDYERTTGLISLLTKKNPQNYDKQDLLGYKSMLQDTKYHLKKDGVRIKSKVGNKYKIIISEFFPEYNSRWSVKTSSSLTSSPQAASTPFKIQHKNSLMRNMDETQSSMKLSLPYYISEDDDDDDNNDNSVHINSGYGFKLPTQMTLINNSDCRRKTQYTYWDDPNELVERLYLLHCSKEAGNTGLDNEIISIVEELREAGYII